MESISSILQWLWGTRASAQRRSLFGRMTHLSKYDVWNRWGNSLLYTLRELIFYWCTPLFITDMPSEKATVSSKSSKTSRRRNLLSLTLELKVMWTLFCGRLLNLEVKSSHCIAHLMCSSSAGIYGGFLLGVRSVNGLAFYDWENTELIRRIEIQPKHVRLAYFLF